MSAREVVLVDAGGTNIGSVRYALERLGARARLSCDPDCIRTATHVVLPGVGAAGPGMRKLRDAGLVRILRELRQPLLGVCLGMQLLFEHSAEGPTEGLGLLPGRVVKLEPPAPLRVPHTGWNGLRVLRDDPLLDGLQDGTDVYFVHAYAAPPGEDTLAVADYGIGVSAVVRRGNVCGVQFHPERSAKAGARLLRNFLAL